MEPFSSRQFKQPGVAGPAGVHLRRATPTDAPQILALEQHFPGDRMSPRALRRLLRAPTARIWVATTAGDALGALVMLVRADSGKARIYSVVVAPQARGLGLGRRLVQAAEREARRLGRHAVGLEVRADNVPARALYERLGYRQVGVLPGYYEDGADGLRLLKTFDVPD